MDEKLFFFPLDLTILNSLFYCHFVGPRFHTILHKKPYKAGRPRSIATKAYDIAPRSNEQSEPSAVGYPCCEAIFPSPFLLPFSFPLSPGDWPPWIVVKGMRVAIRVFFMMYVAQIGNSVFDFCGPHI